ncbi:MULTISPECIES: hypothetical protein [unclassified Psychrobacter]|uniref:hypothetical protein n=1 Tax=unclassified Psychrobacter TaxID=196806 RepID=UPI0018F6C6FF|nr:MULTISPECIES: hypothetical protein [unclassified Psychrobacter]
MSKGFLIAIATIMLVIGGIWGVGNIYKPNPAASNATNNQESGVNLTEEERQRLISAFVSNYTYTGNKDKIDQALEEIQSRTDPTVPEMNQFVIDEYQKSMSELENLARQGDYQAQRNFAFAHATDPKVAGADPVTGCAWYLVLYNSDAPQINDADLSNINLYCGTKMLSVEQQSGAETETNLLLKTIYDKDSDIKISSYING